MSPQSHLESTSSYPKAKSGLHFFELEGGDYHVFDPSTCRHFQLGREQVEWLKLLDGNRSKDSLTLRIPHEHFETFLNNAERMSLLEEQSTPRGINPFFVKMPLCNPNNSLDALGQLSAVYRSLLSRFSAVLLLANALALVIVTQRGHGVLAPPSATSRFIVFYILSILLMSVCHELSHSVVAKSYGVAIPALGFALFYGHPIFYADVTGITLLPHKGARLIVLSAGILANNVLITVSLFLYLVCPDQLSVYCLYFAWMNVVVMIINLIPFVEFDGYHIFKELVNEQDLLPRVQQGCRAGRLGLERFSYYFMSNVFALALVASMVLALRRLGLQMTDVAATDGIYLILLIAGTIIFVQAKNNVKVGERATENAAGMWQRSGVPTIWRCRDAVVLILLAMAFARIATHNAYFSVFSLIILMLFVPVITCTDVMKLEEARWQVFFLSFLNCVPIVAVTVCEMGLPFASQSIGNNLDVVFVFVEEMATITIVSGIAITCLCVVLYGLMYATSVAVGQQQRWLS